MGVILRAASLRAASLRLALVAGTMTLSSLGASALAQQSPAEPAPASSASPAGTAPASAEVSEVAPAAGAAPAAGEAPAAPPAASDSGSVPGEAGGTGGTVPAGQPKVSYGARQPLSIDPSGPLSNPKDYSISVTGGSAWFDSGTASTVFEPWTSSVRIQLARQWFSQVQLNADLGILSDSGYSPGASSGEASGEVTQLNIWSLSLGLSYRFDYFEEQTLVPFVAAGLTAGAVKLASDIDGTTTEEALGNRLGTHVGGGLEFLLDRFGPARAADLELNTGINDTYLVLDVRYQFLNRFVEDAQLKQDSTVLDLSGIQATAGIKFDF